MKICLCKWTEKIKQNENLPLYLCLVIIFLLGMIAGFLIAPVKKGIAIGNNNRMIDLTDADDDDDED
ncbi:MAG: hypothetical protein K2H29_12775 [Oscillospiraceae bacterium]|nr:hypothetical protein [Oscillospiraceae bacterium]MDE5885935.1 hypothetical protein [Oscillospiraceae bacterium]